MAEDTQKKKPKRKVSKKIASKKKVKEKSKELTTQLASGKLSKINQQHLVSILGDSAEEIQSLFEDNEGDGAQNLLYKRLLQTLVDVIPYAEHNIRDSKGQRGVYQFNTLITSIRELLIDIQSSKDRGRMGELIFERIIVPELMTLGTEIVYQLDVLRTYAKNRMTNEGYSLYSKEVEKSQDRLAEEINLMARNVRQKAIEYLQR